MRNQFVSVKALILEKEILKKLNNIGERIAALEEKVKKLENASMYSDREQ